MTGRLARLTESELSTEQLAVFRSITGGPRGSGPQLFELQDDRGTLNGPFGVMLHAPLVGLALQELGAAIRYQTTLTDRAREIAILAVGAATGSVFEWYAHERVGRAVGLSEFELGSLKAGTFDGADRVESAILKTCSLMLADTTLSERDYAEISEAMGDQQLIETVVLVGYYRTLAQLMEVFDIGVPADSREH